MTRMDLSPKQLEALSTLTGPAALDGTLSFDDVLRAVLLFCPDGHVPRVFSDILSSRGPQVAIGIADVARLLLAQREAKVGHDVQAALEELAEWRSGTRINVTADKWSKDGLCLHLKPIGHVDADLAIPPVTLDGRTRPVDPTEREVATFGVGSISPEAEAMRRGEVL